MPIGPSHGARGGGFSSGSDSGRSRGGSSRGGGSFLGSVVGHVLGAAILTSGARRRRRRFESRHGYTPSDEEYNSMPRRKAPTIFLILAIITAVIAAFTMVFRNTAVSNAKNYTNRVEIMKSDWLEYKDLIDKAKEGGHEGYYTTTAYFSTNKYSSYSANPTKPGAYLDFTENGIQYYFIVYTYEVNGEDYKGSTYTQFSASQINGWNGEIAYRVTDSGEVYSINLNYNLETCAEYKYYNKLITSYNDTAKNHLIAFIVELLIIALFVFLYVIKLKKHKKLVAQDEELLLKKQQAETEKAEAEADAAQSIAQRHNRFCQYCGGQLDADSNTCASCGAKFSQE